MTIFNKDSTPEKLSQSPVPSTGNSIPDVPKRRKVIAEDFFGNPFLKTIHRRGFKFDWEKQRFVEILFQEMRIHYTDQWSVDWKNTVGGVVCVQVPSKNGRVYERIEYGRNPKGEIEVIEKINLTTK